RHRPRSVWLRLAPPGGPRRAVGFRQQTRGAGGRGQPEESDARQYCPFGGPCGLITHKSDSKATGRWWPRAEVSSAGTSTSLSPTLLETSALDPKVSPQFPTCE